MNSAESWGLKEWLFRVLDLGFETPLTPEESEAQVTLLYLAHLTDLELRTVRRVAREDRRPNGLWEEGVMLHLRGHLALCDSCMERALGTVRRPAGTISRLAPMPLRVPQLLAADAEATVVLEGAPQGLRAEVRWPGGDARKVIQIALVLTDWGALGLDARKPAQVGLRIVGRTPKAVPWAGWIFLGTWEGTIRPGQRRTELPVTEPGVALTEKQLVIVRDWINKHLRLVPPWQVD